MAVFPERRTSRRAQWAKRLSFFAGVLFVVAGFGHRFGVVDTLAFLSVLGIVGMLALLGLLLAISGFSRLWRYGDKAGKASLAASLMSAAVLAPFLIGAFCALRYPMFYDVATDPVDPPQFERAASLRTARMNPIVPITPENARLQMERYPEVRGRRYDISADQIVQALETVIRSRGWALSGSLYQAGMPEFVIEAYAPTLVLGFPVDAVFRVTDEGGTTFVDMRMNSRYGRHDLGDGARRVARFMSDLDAEVTRQAKAIVDIPPSSGGEEDGVD